MSLEERDSHESAAAQPTGTVTMARTFDASVDPPKASPSGSLFPWLPRGQKVRKCSFRLKRLLMTSTACLLYVERCLDSRDGVTMSDKIANVGSARFVG